MARPSVAYRRRSVETANASGELMFAVFLNSGGDLRFLRSFGNVARANGYAQEVARTGACALVYRCELADGVMNGGVK